MFELNLNIHLHFTWHAEYYKPHFCRTKIKKFSILFKGPNLWNSFPLEIKSSYSYNSFKANLKKHLVDLLKPC